MRRAHLATLAVLTGAVLLGIAWRADVSAPAPAALPVLYGNVDIRQVDLAFDAEGRVARLEVQEGDSVTPGEVLARLEDDTLRSLYDLAQARRQASESVLDKLLAGSRPEEIARDSAMVDAYRATLTDAEAVLARRRSLASQGVVARQQYDDALAAERDAEGRLRAAQETLRLTQIGPRQEDIAAARAQLRADRAAEALAKDRLAHAELEAPDGGIVLSRNVEPGTVVLPTTAVYTVALTHDVWVRSFLPEPILGEVKPGQRFRILTDSQPNRPYHAVVGFVSPTAEFTPKTVETPELRTQLVYRMRLHVLDADAGLRQGMPVTLEAGGR